MMTLTDPVHFSNLKLFAQSPAHFLASIGVEEDKLAFRLGRLTHALTLGVQSGDRWEVYEGRRQGKEWEKFRDARPGVDIYTTKEKALCLAMANAINAMPIAMDLLDGEFEIPVEWKHESGRACATRGLDVLNRKRRYLVDLKTAQSTHPARFARDAGYRGYHAQGSFYRDAARSIGADIDEVFVIGVEKKLPHVVTVARFTPRMLTEGGKLIRSWMEQLQICEEAKSFPGYAQHIVDIDVPDAAPDGLVWDDEDDEEAA